MKHWYIKLDAAIPFGVLTKDQNIYTSDLKQGLEFSSEEGARKHIEKEGITGASPWPFMWLADKAPK